MQLINVKNYQFTPWCKSLGTEIWVFEKVSSISRFAKIQSEISAIKQAPFQFYYNSATFTFFFKWDKRVGHHITFYNLFFSVHFFVIGPRWRIEYNKKEKKKTTVCSNFYMCPFRFLIISFIIFQSNNVALKITLLSFFYYLFLLINQTSNKNKEKIGNGCYVFRETIKEPSKMMPRNSSPIIEKEIICTHKVKKTGTRGCAEKANELINK